MEGYVQECKYVVLEAFNIMKILLKVTKCVYL